MKRYNLPILFLLAFQFLSLTAFSQAAVTSAGTYATSATGYDIIYAVGEVAVQHVIGPEYILDEGIPSPYSVEALSVPNVERLPIELSVFPNPTTNSVTISASEIQSPLRCQIFDAQGRQLSQVMMPNRELSIALSTFPTGVYILTIDDGSARTNRYRIVKK